MKSHDLLTCVAFVLLAPVLLAAGCSVNREIVPQALISSLLNRVAPDRRLAESRFRVVILSGSQPVDTAAIGNNQELAATIIDTTKLEFLEQMALDQNPGLQRLEQKEQAARSRSQYVDQLPDPRVGANLFAQPLETATGSQRANLRLSQVIPSLSKLDTEQQRASINALAARADYESARLQVLAGIRAGWYRLYVIDRQTQIAKANQDLLKSLIDVANARIATGTASVGDVLLGTLELSQLEERLATYRRRRTAVEAEMNRLLARPAETVIEVPDQLDIGSPSSSAAEILQIAIDSHPEIQAARLRAEAARLGIEIARLRREPEVTLALNFFFTDDNRVPNTMLNVGEDPWSVGLQVSVPIWQQKYDAMQAEATSEHRAVKNSLAELTHKYDALILDLLAETRRAMDTASLYDMTILPQARQTLQADLESYSNGSVEFDRVVRDYRNLLTLEVGYHQAIGDLGIAVARLRQLAGGDIPLIKLPPKKTPENE